LFNTTLETETSFGSLKESFYCRYLAKCLDYILDEDYQKALKLKEEIAAMLYSTIQGIKNKRGTN
jgi:four helix bundle protein